jgi:hypothetical protein
LSAPMSPSYALTSTRPEPVVLAGSAPALSAISGSVANDRALFTAAVACHTRCAGSGRRRRGIDGEDAVQSVDVQELRDAGVQGRQAEGEAEHRGAVVAADQHAQA